MNLKFIKKLLVPLFLKGSGMLISFISMFIIINIYSLEIFGKYAQSVSFLLFLSGIASFGYPQSIFRDSALMNFFQKKKLFNQMFLNTVCISILISPILILFFYFIEGLNVYQIMILIFIFWLMATSRLRFSLLRTTKHVKYAEVPEQIVKPLILVISILILPKDDINSLYIALFLGLLSAFVVNHFFLKRYYTLPSKFEINKELININIKNTNTQLWISNVLILFKDFIELFMIGFLLGDLISGEYKIILQVYVLLMAVFNTMALINSMSFAKLIALKKYSEVNKKALSEMAPSLMILTLIIFVLILAETIFKVSDYMQLSEVALYSILIFMMFSIINIAIGPITQLLLHSRQIKKIILMTTIRVLSVCFSALLANITSSQYQILIFTICLLFAETIVLLFAARSLYFSIGYISPIYQKLILRTKK